MSEKYTAEHLHKMEAASHLLPDPGGEVVRELIQEIIRLRAENDCLQKRIKRAHEDRAGYAVEIGRLRRDKIRLLGENIKAALGAEHE